MLISRLNFMLMLQILLVLAGVSGAVTLSKVNYEFVKLEIQYLQAGNPDGWKRTINFNTLLCCALLLFACGSTLLLEIILLPISLVQKGSKIFVIVVSYLHEY